MTSILTILHTQAATGNRAAQTELQRYEQMTAAEVDRSLSAWATYLENQARQSAHGAERCFRCGDDRGADRADAVTRSYLQLAQAVRRACAAADA